MPDYENGDKMSEAIKEYLESLPDSYPIVEYAFGKVSDIPFSDKVWYICKTDCKRYGKSWSCPPNCGDLNEMIEHAKSFENMYVLSCVYEVPNSWDPDSCIPAKNEHEAMAREINEKLKSFGEDFVILSTGCSICESCACPDEPCRHPEERIYSMESHGVMIMQLADEMGLCFNYGGDTMVYFSMVLFN